MAYFREAMPVLLQLVTHPSFSFTELAEQQSRMPLHGIVDAIRACLEHYRKDGRIRAGEAALETATLTLVSTVHSLVLFERMGVHGGSFPDPVVRRVVDLLVAGLLAEQGSDR